MLRLVWRHARLFECVTTGKLVFGYTQSRPQSPRFAWSAVETRGSYTRRNLKKNREALGTTDALHMALV